VLFVCDGSAMPVPVLRRGGLTRRGHIQIRQDGLVAIDGAEVLQPSDRQGAFVGYSMGRWARRSAETCSGASFTRRISGEVLCVDGGQDIGSLCPDDGARPWLTSAAVCRSSRGRSLSAATPRSRGNRGARHLLVARRPSGTVTTQSARLGQGGLPIMPVAVTLPKHEYRAKR